MIRAVLVDDHALIRRGLRELLSEASAITIVGEASSYAQWAELSRQVTCDILVLDLNLPGRSGMDVLAAALDRDPAARVLILSHHSETEYGVRALKAGAMGYLSKNSEPEQITEAVVKVAAGLPYVSQELSALLINTVRNRDACAPHHDLSDREMQTLLCIAKGIKRASIAQSLALSPKTISVYRTRVMQKLGVFTDAAMAAYAIRHDLVDG